MTIETKRLFLRELTHDDIEPLHAVLSDPVAMRHYPKPFDREMTRKWIEWNLENYAVHGFGLWAVIHREEGRLIGDCGLTIQQVDGVGELEIGYHILRSHWGKGFATEGAAACRDYVFDNLKKKRVISWMTPENLSSRRVAVKIGMRPEKESTNKIGTISVVYSMRPEDRLR